jgi:uncharacterized protein YxeA
MVGNKKNLILIVLVIIIVLAGYFVWKQIKQPKIETVVTQIESTEDVGDATSTKSGTNIVPSLSYQKALVLYKDKRIQFDKDKSVCAATPNHATYKSGTTIMLDNRANEARTIKIGATYTVKAYGFKLVKLSSTKLPVTWLVDCDEHQNVATILLQK